MDTSSSPSTIEAFTSHDGSTWASEGTTSAALTEQVTAGLFVCGNEYSRGPFMAGFSNVSDLPHQTDIARGSETTRRDEPLITFIEERVTIHGLQGDGSSEIAVFDLRGRELLRDRTNQAEYSAVIPGRGEGMCVVYVKNRSGSHCRVTGPVLLHSSRLWPECGLPLFFRFLAVRQT